MRLPPAPFLYPIVDVAQLRGRTIDACVHALAAAGCRLVQLRAKQGTDRERLEQARELVAACRACGVAAIVNDRPDVARIVGADGVHVGQDDLAPEDVRRVLPDTLVGISTHGLEQLATALRQRVDYVAVGPIFATGSKEDPDPVVGLELVRRARALTPLPIVAIGGITLDNAADVIAAGADAVAVISALLAADDLASATRAFGARLGAASV